MATLVENPQGFKIIALSSEEAQALNFGFEEGCVCMHCNEIIEEPIFFVCVLNDTMCQQCLEEWLSYATSYPEDKPYEDRVFNYYKNILDL